MRKEDQKRSLCSWVLLAVFVPMLLFSSLHLHQDEQSAQTECAECVDHHCAGHLGQQSVSFHACVLCQFLSLPFLAVAVTALVLFNKVRACALVPQQYRRQTTLRGAISLRAPPACCFR